jgi:hypothetical protein
LIHNYKPIINILPYISVFAGLVPVLLYIQNRTNLPNFKLISIYLGYEFITDLFLNPASIFLFKSEFAAAHLFTLIEFFIFNYFFYSISTKAYRKKISIFFSSLFLFVFTYENFIVKDQRFDSLTVGTSTIFIISLAVMSLIDLTKKMKTKESNSFIFLAISSILIYFSGTLFIYLLSKAYYSDINFNKYYYIINPTIQILRDLLFIYAIYLQKEKKSNNQIRSILTT